MSVCKEGRNIIHMVLPALNMYSFFLNFLVAGIVTNVRVINCNTLEWSRPANDGGEIAEYRVRVFSGTSYRTADERRTFSTTTPRLVMDWLPSEGPITVIVSTAHATHETITQ